MPKNLLYQYFEVCYPKSGSCASKPLQLRCKLIICECLCQVSLRFKEVQKGAQVIYLNNRLFCLKSGIIIRWISSIILVNLEMQ